jgi:hypothetical protein
MRPCEPDIAQFRMGLPATAPNGWDSGPSLPRVRVAKQGGLLNRRDAWRLWNTGPSWGNACTDSHADALGWPLPWFSVRRAARRIQCASSASHWSVEDV